MLRLGLVIVALAAVAACGGSGAGDDGGTAGPAASAGAGEGVALEGETLDGARLALADLRGKPVFVNVWASW